LSKELIEKEMLDLPDLERILGKRKDAESITNYNAIRGLKQNKDVPTNNPTDNTANVK